MDDYAVIISLLRGDDDDESSKLAGWASLGCPELEEKHKTGVIMMASKYVYICIAWPVSVHRAPWGGAASCMNQPGNVRTTLSVHLGGHWCRCTHSINSLD